ncbi:hypothetical protein OIO90_005543 [Microbotryomycetes sp. JL221]|nr:hypothetical protein OIO90_005543 [Microbotryomycetes sp. JL221]
MPTDDDDGAKSNSHDVNAVATTTTDHNNDEQDALVGQLEWDTLKAHQAQQTDRADLFLLNWLTNCLNALDKLPNSVIVAHQQTLTTRLLTIITPPSPTTQVTQIKPGRPARAIIARVLITLLTKGEQKHLFDIGQTLLKGLVGIESKIAAEKDKEWRIACAYCLGEIWLALGQQVMSLFIDLVTTTMRVARTTSYPVILRYNALLTLRKGIVVGSQSMSDLLTKETLKSLKALMNEKAGAIVRAAADCILALSAAPGTFSGLVEIDSVVTPALKAIETADFATRRSLSALVAGLLAHTQIEGSGAIELNSTSKKKKQTTTNENQDQEDNDPYPNINNISSNENSKKTLLTIVEMLNQLSIPFNRLSSTRQFRNGIIDVYGELFTALGSSWIEQHYVDVLKHVVNDIGCGIAAGSGWTNWTPRSIERLEPTKARFEALMARKAVKLLMKDVITGRLLSEGGQVAALRDVAETFLRQWPSLMPGKQAPTKQALVIALEETNSLLHSLGCAPPAIQDVLFEPLVRLVAHPSHSVQVSAAWALRTFCDVASTRLSTTIVHVVDLLNKDLALIASTGATDVHKRAIGYSQALASLINLIPHKPLYVSFDVSAKCMSLAIQLLKQSGNHELHISGVEIRIAWILVSALMSLGPNFVRLHLPQLLILWRNALPKPTSKDASVAQVRSEREWAFLLHIRECTLGAILSFLRHNSSLSSSSTMNGLGTSSGSATTASAAAGSSGASSSSNAGLVTDDVGRRLVALLANGLAFSKSFATCHSNIVNEQQIPSTSSRLSLFDRDVLFRRRLFECFVALGQSSATLPHQVELLQQVTTVFSDPERYVGEAVLQAAVNAGTFTTIWDEADGYAYGVTSLLQEGHVAVAGSNAEMGRRSSEESLSTSPSSMRLNRDSAESKIFDQMRRAIVGAGEYDPLVLSARQHSDVTGLDGVLSPPPPAIGLVNAAIELFAQYFGLQETSNQSALLQIIGNNYRSSRLEKNPGRKMAILANSSAALLGALRMFRRNVDPTVGTHMRDLIKESLLCSDSRIRLAAAESLGRLSGLGGTSFMASQIQFCVTQVVSNTDPHNRAGCALAFGQIYSHVGSLAAGPVLKTIVDVLLSLSADPHPLVHYHALQALAQVIDAASLSYAPFTNSTLGMLCKLYMQDTHEPEGGSPGSVNLRADLPAYQAICRVLDALIGVLGPELQESERVRELVMILLNEFVRESDDGVEVEAIKATQHFLIFAPTAMNQNVLMATLRRQLSSNRQPLKVAVVNSVYQLVQRDATLVSKLGGDGLVRELFALLDDDPRIEGVRHAIMSWLRQTADSNPSGWIDLCQQIMSRSTGSKAADEAAVASAQAPGGFVDEESQGLGVESGTSSGPGSSSVRTTSRWRTQLFALQCLHEVFTTVKKSRRREHFDIARARALRANRRSLLISRVGDLIKMAFTASTAQVMQIRLEGLVVLRDVIENFAQSQDIDFEDALLLEQFQAPIAAALTPAFAGDSFPEVIASAVQVCAIFVGSGVVKEIDKMGRILKLLTTALESCKHKDVSSIGDVKDLSSTAGVMLKTSIFAAWAKFQTASVRQPYLRTVIEPHLPQLCPSWVASLRDFAQLRTDPDATASDSGAGGSAFDSVYSGLSRETALPFYEQSWPSMLHAIGVLLRDNNELALMAVNGGDQDEDSIQRKLISADNDRNEPAQYFWILFGLSFESLCTGEAGVQEMALESLAGLVRRPVSGTALFQPGLFDELCNLCFRLAITEGPSVKARVMDIVLQLASLASSSPTLVNGSSSKEPSDARMIQCLRVATCILRETVPSSSSSARPNVNTVQAHAALIKRVFAGFADLADLQQGPLREQLYAIAFQFYSQLLRDESAEVDLVSPTLPVLKSLVERSLAPLTAADSSLPRVINGLLSACLQNIDSLRGRQGAAVGIKTRGNLLAAILLLTNLPSHVKIGSEVVDHTCSLTSEIALSPEHEAAPVAMHCLSSLLSASRGAPVLQYCVTRLVPTLIEYIATVGRNIEAKKTVVPEVVKCLVSFASNVDNDRKTQAMSILLPVLSLLLQPTKPMTTSTSSNYHALAVTYLLQLASTQPRQFKEAITSMSEDERNLIETSVRAQVGNASNRKDNLRNETPQISLKSFAV